MTIAVIAFAFGQQQQYTPGPSNEAIGTAALRIRRMTKGVLATQWEVDVFLRTVRQPADFVVSEYGTESHYLTTEQAFTKSLEYFDSLGDIDEIVLVAHPVHLMVLRHVMKRWNGYSRYRFTRRYDYMLRQIPWDRSRGNTQRWTRGFLRFVIYLAKASLTGQHGE